MKKINACFLWMLIFSVFALPGNLFAAFYSEKNAKEAFINKDWDRVIEIAYHLREDAKATPVPYLLLAHAYYNKGDYQKIPFFLEFIDNQEKKKALLGWAEEFVREYPQHPLPRLLKADACVRLKKYSDAFKEFDAAEKLGLNSSLVYAARGMNCAFNNTNDLAIENFNRSLELEPNCADTYNSRGIVYFCRQDYEQALSDFNQAIKINPGFTLAYLGRARVYYCLGKTNLAQEDLKKVKEFDGEGFSFSSNTFKDPSTGKLMRRFSIKLETNPSKFEVRAPAVKRPLISGSFGKLKGVDSRPQGIIRKIKEGVLMNEEKLDDRLIVPASHFLLYNDQFLFKAERRRQG